MGLDTVELVMEFENYFGISIPNADAESLHNIQSVVEYVSSVLNIYEETSGLKEITLDRLIKALQVLNGNTEEIKAADLIGILLNPQDHFQLARLSNEIGFPIPELNVRPNTHKSKWVVMLSKLSLQPIFDWSLVTVDRLNDAINMFNIDKLVDKRNLASKYEIYLAVGQLTIDKSGVDYLEIEPGKSFTSDLGLD